PCIFSTQRLTLLTDGTGVPSYESVSAAGIYCGARRGENRISEPHGGETCRSPEGISMTGREIIAALRAGRRVYSSAIVATSPLWPNLAKQAGIDFVFVDTEHTPVGRETLSWTCQTY